MRSVEIAGAGVGGLVASIALARGGWSVRVHERSAELRPHGNALGIFDVGFRVFEYLGLIDEIYEAAYNLEKYTIRSNTGEIVVEYSPEEAIASESWMIRRQALHGILTKAAFEAGVEICLSSRITGATRSGSLMREDGRIFEADVVIGADGANSSVRAALTDSAEVFRHRKGAIRLLFPRRAGDMPQGYERAAADHNDPSGRRVGILPCGDDTLYMVLSSMRDDLPAHQVPVRKDIWIDTFPALGGYFERLEEQGHYDVFQTVKLPAWHFGRSALVGDAAHSMTPSLGLGACTAMMNAFALGMSLARGSDVEVSLATWDQAMRPSVERIQDYCFGMTEGLIDPNFEVFWGDPVLKELYTTDVTKLLNL